MKSSIVATALTLAALALTGCGEDVKTVDWWAEHEDERKSFVEECRNDNQKEVTANCQNAIEADLRHRISGDEEGMKAPSIHR